MMWVGCLRRRADEAKRTQMLRMLSDASLMAFSTASRVSPVRFWMRPSSSSCLPSTKRRSSSVKEAHFCFNLPLVMFQPPLISMVFICVVIFAAYVAANGSPGWGWATLHLTRSRRYGD